MVGLALLFAVAFGLTADWGFDANVDAVAASLPAWTVATQGTLFLDEFASVNPWMTATDAGWVSNRPPGLIAIAVPAYFVTQPDSFTNAPGTATAIAATIAGLLVLYVVMCKVASPTTAMLATVVFGLGTSTWQVSSEALWPHGPGQLWAALALAGLAAASPVRAGWALAAGLLTRPITVLSAAAIALLESTRARSWRPLVSIGLPVGIATVALVVYNAVFFGEPTVTGGYGTEFVTRAFGDSLLDHAARFAGFFVSPANGMLVWSPIIAIALLGLVRAWPAVPPWARSAAIASLIYVIAHARLNRVSGGIPFGYRYPLEALMLAAPALLIGALEVRKFGTVGKRLVLVTAGSSIVLQGLLVFFVVCSESADATVTCRFFGSG